MNNNNNYQAPALPGALANPTPGTIVVHVNGKVQVDFQATWSSVDTRVAAAPAAGSLGAVLGQNGTGSVKLQPQAIDSFARIYLGGDAMATNGLRYGAAIEVRQNFTGQISNNGSSGASGYSSLETLFVRRAFTYVAGEQWGIVRVGQADGLISIFDNGVTTFQFLPTGNLNGGDLQNIVGGAIAGIRVPGAGGQRVRQRQGGLSVAADRRLRLRHPVRAEHVERQRHRQRQHRPLSRLTHRLRHRHGQLLRASPTPDVRRCRPAPASRTARDRSTRRRSACATRASSAPRACWPTSWARAASTPTTPALTTAAVLGTTTTPGSKFNGSYNDLAIGSAGVAATFAGFTVGGNVVGGQMNGQLGLQPKGGAPLIGFLLGAKYVTGPLTVGIVGEEFWEQGNVKLQRHHASVRGRGDRRRRQLYRGARLHRCSPSISGTTRRRARTTSSPARSERRPAANAEQQHQRPGLPDRQRGELLTLHRGVRRKTGGGVIPRRFFVVTANRCARALATRAGTVMESVVSA